MSDIKFEANNSTGIILALLTAFLWGTIPLALVYCLVYLDGVTITWFRFTMAAIVCFIWQLRRGQLNEFSRLTLKDWGVLTLAGIFLILDYVAYTMALNYISPIATTIFSQATPFFLCIGGIIVFKERLNFIQILSFTVLFLGLILFFNDSLASAISDQKMLVIGVVITVFASLIWVFYALLQKSLFTKLSTTNILLFIYGFAIISLAPFSELSHFNHINGYVWIVLIFCALNTIIGYWAFTQSMRHIDTTKISTIIATIPLITIAASYLSFMIWPKYIKFEQINLLGWVGIFLVVISVIIFNHQSKPTQKENMIS